MLTIVEFSKKQRKLSRETVSMGTVRFAVLTVRAPGRRGVPPKVWERVAGAAGGEREHLLFAGGVVPPDGYGLGTFAGGTLPGGTLRRALMAAAAVKIVSLSPRPLSVAVYDPQARLPALPLALLGRANVTVVTRLPGAYAAAAAKAMGRYGAVLPVTESPAALGRCGLIVAPEGLTGRVAVSESVGGCTSGIFPVPISSHALLLSGAPDPLGRAVDSYVPAVPPGWLSAKPAGVDACAFLAGLYERSGAGILAEAPPLLLFRGDCPLSWREMESQIAECR